MSDQLQWQQQSLLLQQNISQNFIQPQPQIPSIICGYVTFPNSLFFCFSSHKYLVLQPQYARFYQSQQQQQIYKQIQINQISQIKSYKRKHLYCIRLIIMNNFNQEINMKFINKDVCRQWMGYFGQAIQFNNYLKEIKQFYKKQSFQKYIQTILQYKNKQKSQSNLSSTKTNIIILSDTQNTIISQSIHSHITCESTFKGINKKIIKLSMFNISHKIDSGSFSTVYLANYKNKKIALKQMKKQKLLYKGQMKYALTQLNCLIKSKQCPYIIPLYFAFQTHEYLYLALKYIPYGNLSTLIKSHQKLSQQSAIILLAQLVIAIQYLHSNKILYRDLKPQNILIDQNGHLYLTDFGLAIELNENQYAHSFLGTPLYLAPERFIGENNGVDYKSDIYAVGVIFFQMLHGYHPYFADNFNSVVYNIKNTQIEQQISSQLSNHSKNFLLQTLQKNPSKRLSKMSEHPIFYKLNMKKIQLKQHKGIEFLKKYQKNNNMQINYEIDYDYNQNNYPDKKIINWNYNHQEKY